jgi:hypothetical protein
MRKAIIAAAAGAGLLVTFAAPPTAHVGLASDGFWSRLHFEGSEVEQYDGLEQMARASDAVVFGRVSDVSAGRVLGDPAEGFPHPEEGLAHYVNLQIEIDEILAGRLPSDHMRALTLEMMTATPGEGDSMVKALPGEQVIFFLRNKGIEARQLGQSEAAADAESKYYRLVIVDGLLQVADGAVRPAPYADEPFILAMGGSPVAEVTARIRAATEH